MFERLRVHTAETLNGTHWDLTLLARVGTEITRQNYTTSVPTIQPPSLTDPDSGADNDDSVWKPYMDSDTAGWELKDLYDTADGPVCFRPTRDRPTRLRMTAALGLRCGGAIVGAYIRVEAYSKVEAQTLTLTDGDAVIDASMLMDSAAWAGNASATNHRKRVAPVVFADMNGPRWPTASAWKQMPHGSRTAVTWSPKRRMHWVSLNGKVHVIVAIKVWAHADAAEDAPPTEDWDPTGGESPAPAAPAAPPTGRADTAARRGPRITILSREVQPPQWVAIAANDGVITIPPAHESRNRLIQRLLIDAEEGFRCRSLLPDSFNSAFKAYNADVERMLISGKVVEGHEFVFGNLNGHMNFIANFLLMLEYSMDVRMYHPQARYGISFELGSAQTRSWRTASNGFAEL